MKLQRLAHTLDQAAGTLSSSLANFEELHVSQEEFFDVVMMPEEQRAYRLLAPKLEAEFRYHTTNVGFGPGLFDRVVEFRAVDLKERVMFEKCNVAGTIPETLLERIDAWYVQRLHRGHLAAAFRAYVGRLIKDCPTPAHMYHLFDNATVLFRAGGLSREETLEALRVRPRDPAIIPLQYKSLAEAATQAAVMMELLDLPKKHPDRKGVYRVDLPSNRRHLRVTYEVPRFPETAGVTLEPL